MTRLVLAPASLQDMKRRGNFLMENHPQAARETSHALTQGLALILAIRHQREQGHAPE